MSGSDGGSVSESPAASLLGDPESGVEVDGGDSVQWGVSVEEDLNV